MGLSCVRTPYSGQVLHGQLVQRHVLRLCLEDGSSRESVGLSEGHLERNRWQSELFRASPHTLLSHKAPVLQHMDGAASPDWAWRQTVD